MCLAANCTLARVNLSLRPRLEDGKASLAIKYQELREIREACWDKQQRLGELGCSRWDHGQNSPCWCEGLAGLSILEPAQPWSGAVGGDGLQYSQPSAGIDATMGCRSWCAGGSRDVFEEGGS